MRTKGAMSPRRFDPLGQHNGLRYLRNISGLHQKEWIKKSYHLHPLQRAQSSLQRTRACSDVRQSSEQTTIYADARVWGLSEKEGAAIQLREAPVVMSQTRVSTHGKGEKGPSLESLLHTGLGCS